MNEHDIQYHLKHRQQEFQIEGASRRKAQGLENTPSYASHRRRKLKQVILTVSNFVLLLAIF